VILLGIDPALRHTGVAVISSDESGQRLARLYSGVIEVDDTAPFGERMRRIFTGVRDICARFQPDAMMVEETYVNLNPRSSIALAHGRAAAICGAMDARCINVESVTPSEVKRIVSGSGAATKAEVAFHVQRVFPDLGTVRHDETDSLAVALCLALRFRARKIGLVARAPRQKSTRWRASDLQKIRSPKSRNS
jgi:crossover junction endodeoxyribonuclease RuvC